jgi:hypothetical protein
MSTFHIDLANGNDASDGSSWANAWKTIRNGATAARIAPGDTIRIAKTPDPVSLGVNVTFAERNRTATLASALTENIDLCENSWTSDGGADVVCSTQNALCQGSYSSQIQIKAAFGTGLAAHRQVTEIDLSSYQNVSFLIYSSVAVAANSLRLDLCSDTAGATPVESITIDRALVAGKKYPILYKKGSALASSIQSVALTVLTDLGGSDANIRLDNIIAANNLHHNSLIGKSGGPYLPVRAINGTSVSMGYHGYYNQDAGTNWRVAETVAAYAREVYRVVCASDANQECYINEGGSGKWNRITFSAGYNTGTDVQDGQTWISPAYYDVDGGFQPVMVDLNGQDWLEFRKLCFSGSYYGWYTTNSVPGLTLDNCCMAGVAVPMNANTYNQGHGMHLKGAIDFWTCGTLYLPPNQGGGYAGGLVTQDKDSVITFVVGSNHDVLTLAGGAFFFAGKVVFKGSNYYEVGLLLNSVFEGSYFNEIELENIYTNIRVNSGTGNINIEKLTVTGGNTLFNYNGQTVGRLRVGRYTQASGTPTEWTPAGSGSTAQGYQDLLCFDHYKADNRWKAIGRFGNISDHITGGQAAGWAYGESGLSMLLNPNNQNLPLIYQFTVPVASGTALKLRMQVRKTSSGSDCRLFVNIAGAGITVVQDEEVTLTDSWAEYASSSFTPSRAGFITVRLCAFDGASTGDIGIDEITVAAAA